MGPQSSLESLRELMARQGVEPTDEDLEAVQVFLDAILPELELVEELLDQDART